MALHSLPACPDVPSLPSRPSRFAPLFFPLATLGLLVYFGIHGGVEIADINDFEVYYMAAELTAESSGDIYNARSPEKGRPFLYPPAGAVLLVPLTWLPESAAGWAFSLLKALVLPAFLFLGLALASPARSRVSLLEPAALLTLLAAFRPIDADFSSGQMNLLAGSLAFAGIALLMSRHPLAFAGAAVFAVGVCLKPPPALFILVPLLHLRWTRFLAAAAMLLLFGLGLPYLWFGGETATALRRQFADKAPGLMMEAKAGEDQVSLPEFLMFTVAQARAPEDLVWRGGRLYTPSGPAGSERVRLPEPFSPAAARSAWLTLCILTLSLWFALRQWAFRGRPKSWAWDLASLSLVVILLSPVARKAHLAVILPAVAWLAAHAIETVRLEGSLGLALRRRPAWAAALLAATLLLYIADDLPVPFPGFPIPYHPAPLLGIITLMGLLLVTAGSTKDLPPDEPPPPASR